VSRANYDLILANARKALCISPTHIDTFIQLERQKFDDKIFVVQIARTSAPRLASALPPPCLRPASALPRCHPAPPGFSRTRFARPAQLRNPGTCLGKRAGVKRPNDDNQSLRAFSAAPRAYRVTRPANNEPGKIFPATPSAHLAAPPGRTVITRSRAVLSGSPPSANTEFRGSARKNKRTPGAEAIDRRIHPRLWKVE
jgi:hypothetical protein